MPLFFTQTTNFHCNGLWIIFRNDECAGNTSYYRDSDVTRPDEDRFWSVEKYPKKLMVGIAKSDRGISEHFFCPPWMSWNGEICYGEYIKRCLDEYHADRVYYYWPDLAASQDAHAKINLCQERNVANIPRSVNTHASIALSWGLLRTFGGGSRPKRTTVGGRPSLRPQWSTESCQAERDQSGGLAKTFSECL